MKPEDVSILLDHRLFWSYGFPFICLMVFVAFNLASPLKEWILNTSIRYEIVAITWAGAALLVVIWLESRSPILHGWERPGVGTSPAGMLKGVIGFLLARIVARFLLRCMSRIRLHRHG